MLEVKISPSTSPMAGSHHPDNLSFTVPSGQITVITGPNGGGKSTLAKLIMGIERPTSGKYCWTARISPDFPSPRGPVWASVTPFSSPRFKGSPSGGCWRWPTAALFPECCSLPGGALFPGISETGSRCLLSGGELKRIEIATLMARDVRLAIYDEPEAGIDLWSFFMLVASFESFRTNPQQSSIIISHQERIIQLADEIIVIAGAESPRKAARRKSSRFCRGSPELRLHPKTGERPMLTMMQNLLKTIADLPELNYGAYNLRANGKGAAALHRQHLHHL